MSEIVNYAQGLIKSLKSFSLVFIKETIYYYTYLKLCYPLPCPRKGMTERSSVCAEWCYCIPLMETHEWKEANGP